MARTPAGGIPNKAGTQSARVLLHTVSRSSKKCFWLNHRIANLQKMAVAERRGAEPTTGRRNEVGLAVPQATIELLAESCRQ